MGIFLLVLGQLVGFAAPLRVALVVDRGGKDDKSFNASAYAGLQKCEKDLGFQIKVVEATDNSSFEPLTRSLAQKQFDLIINIGVSQAESVGKVAAQFKDQKFSIVDAEVKSPNVRSLMFEEHEGSFLVGAIAAQFSKSGKIGFVGGMDIPLIRRFQLGYETGAKQVKPGVKIITQYVGVTSEAWNNPAKAKELALGQYDQGVDVIYSAAGASGVGIFDAAHVKQKYAIGVDSNQNWIKPGRVLTSMLKRVDQAVFQNCQDLKDGKWSAGAVRYGLKNNGIAVAFDEHNAPLITPELKKTVENLTASVISGKIKVPDFYKIKK